MIAGFDFQGHFITFSGLVYKFDQGCGEYLLAKDFLNDDFSLTIEGDTVRLRMAGQGVTISNGYRVSVKED